MQEAKDEPHERPSSASEQTRLPPRLPSLHRRHSCGVCIPRAPAASHPHDDAARQSRRRGNRSLRIAPAAGGRRAAAAAGRTGHTFDRSCRSLGAPLPPDHQRELEVAFKASERAVGSDVDPTRPRLPLPRGGGDQPADAREGRTGASSTRARRARLASIPREGPQRGRDDGRSARDQQSGAAARWRDARRTPESLARSPDVRQPAAHEDVERARAQYRIVHCTAAIPASARQR